MSDDEQDKYEKEMTTKLEYEAYARECAERARAEGEARGRSEGVAEGEANKCREVAKKMLDLNVPVDIIVQSTGLTDSEIMKL